MTEATGGVAIPVEPYGWLRHPLRALRRQRRARERWRQFAPIADEVVTPADAALRRARRLVRPLPGRLLPRQRGRRPRRAPRALPLRPGARGRRRSDGRQAGHRARLRRRDRGAARPRRRGDGGRRRRRHPGTAGRERQRRARRHRVGDDGILALPVANGSGELAVGDLLPHAATPLVRRLLGWDGRRRSAEPLRRVLARAAARRADEAALAAFGDKAVDVEVARDAGACDAATAARLAARFGDAARVTVADLLPLAHDPSVRRLIDWRLMLAGAASS